MLALTSPLSHPAVSDWQFGTKPTRTHVPARISRISKARTATLVSANAKKFQNEGAAATPAPESGRVVASKIGASHGISAWQWHGMNNKNGEHKRVTLQCRVQGIRA